MSTMHIYIFQENARVKRGNSTDTRYIFHWKTQTRIQVQFPQNRPSNLECLEFFGPIGTIETIQTIKWKQDFHHSKRLPPEASLHHMFSEPILRVEATWAMETTAPLNRIIKRFWKTAHLPLPAPSCPSPKPTLTLTYQLGQNVGLVEG